jgi:hypothetical protein
MKRFHQISGIFAGFSLLVALMFFCSCSRSKSDVTDIKPVAAGNAPAGIHDTIRFIDPQANDLVCFNGHSSTEMVLGPWKTNAGADSITWELVSAPGGTAIEPVSGTGDRAVITLFHRDLKSEGVVMIKATPFRSGYFSRPALFAYSLQIHPEGSSIKDHRPGNQVPDGGVVTSGLTGGNSSPGATAVNERIFRHCNPDTFSVNFQRRKKITEFRDLLFMFANTSNTKEKEFFKSGAEMKLDEFPGRMADILHGNDIRELFSEPFPPDLSVFPVYDNHRCYIVGLKVKRQ